MPPCDRCGATEDLCYRCSYCDVVHCSDHRLPESHDCDGVRFLSDSGKRFESKFSGEVIRSGEGIDPPEPMTVTQTVGTTPEPEWDNPSPDTELKTEVTEVSNPDHSGIVAKVKSILSRRFA